MNLTDQDELPHLGKKIEQLRMEHKILHGALLG